MLDPMFPFVAQVIEAKAVYFGIDQVLQGVLKLPQLSGINETLKDGVLHSLPVILAFLRDFAQSSPTGISLGVYVIGDQNHHRRTQLQKKGG
jgi:hypothetical protein